ncbi:erv26 super protein [Neophaeococcomyces mojaviensis]|uniref:Erv26 super protein n=1 Tax=Neophaeococcomyces mojaviensis TaxID=3383035 RepID=A0ACC3A4A7_9EURO|nr:erv26 super protein [Knufia sp. JES_112]
MYILPLLGYLGLTLGFTFLTLSIASGLYYLSELVEEHSVLSSKLLRRLIYAIIVIQLLLLVDGFPWHLTLLGILSHCIYLTNLRHFPIVKLSDPLFLLSCVLVLVNHWMWFRWFSSPTAFEKRGNLRGRDRYNSGYNYNQPSFTEIASYFGICVWLVPFALFVSLSAGENVLPSMGSEYATGDPHAGNVGLGGGAASERGFKKGHKRRNTGMAKAAVGGVKEWVGETGAVMGLWKGENVRTRV